MRKTICFFVCFVVALLSCFSSYAKETEVSLSCRKSSNNIFYVDVFVHTDKELSGGEFVICFDENDALYKDVESELFEIDAYNNDSQVKVVIAQKDAVNLEDSKTAFSVKFRRNNKSTSDIQLQTILLCDDALNTFVPKNELITATIDMKNGTITDIKNKDTSKKDVSENEITKPDSATDTDSTQTQATSDFVPIKIESDNNKFLVLFSIFGLVVVAFLLGIMFNKTFEKKKNIVDKEID